jgi:hypothetical protein
MSDLVFSLLLLVGMVALVLIDDPRAWRRLRQLAGRLVIR